MTQNSNRAGVSDGSSEANSGQSASSARKKVLLIDDSDCAGSAAQLNIGDMGYVVDWFIGAKIVQGLVVLITPDRKEIALKADDYAVVLLDGWLVTRGDGDKFVEGQPLNGWLLVPYLVMAGLRVVGISSMYGCNQKLLAAGASQAVDKGNLIREIKSGVVNLLHKEFGMSADNVITILSTPRQDGQGVEFRVLEHSESGNPINLVGAEFNGEGEATKWKAQVTDLVLLVALFGGCQVFTERTVADAEAARIEKEFNDLGSLVEYGIDYVELHTPWETIVSQSAVQAAAQATAQSAQQ